MKTTFGRYLKEKRMAAGLGLREMCISAKQDPSNYSKYERDVLIPSKEEDLRRIAKALDIKYKSAHWFELTDLAATGRRELPRDLAGNPRVLELLPAMYQKLRGHDGKDADDAIEALIKHLKKEA